MSMRNKFTLGLLILALALVIPSVVFAASSANSEESNPSTDKVRIYIDGVAVPGPFSKGDIVRDGTIPKDGGPCHTPNIAIRTGGAKKVRVGPDPVTCDVKVLDLEMNTAPLPSGPDDPPASASNPFDGFFNTNINAALLNAVGHKWQVESLAKVVGIY
jgi:hypothetical protein